MGSWLSESGVCAPGIGRSRRVAAVVAGSLLVLLVSACGGRETSKEISAGDFDPANFDRSTRVDNEWFPLRPGTQLVYRGSSIEDGERVSHQVVFTVTDLTKIVGGVRTVVVWERDWTSGELVETELAFFAADNDGNVWHLGQYPEEYEEGKFVTAPAWLHGLKGARAGIAMKAEPRLGSSSYSQGFAPPPINWVDHAKVYRVGQKTCVPADCYEDVLVTREFEPGKTDAYQLKYYARGVGTVRVGWEGAKDESKETLTLVDIAHLRPQEMAAARAEIRHIEQRAYKVSKDVYGRTPPAETSD